MSGEREDRVRERRVIVGVQNSVVGLQALRRGVTEARLRGATVYLVRVHVGVGRFPDAPVQTTELAVWAIDYVEQALANALGGIPRDVEVRSAALEGAPAPALVGFANREGDLLVVGDAQRRGIGRLWSGRVARHCARRATCPVLVVPPPALSRVDNRLLNRELRRLVDAG